VYNNLPAPRSYFGYPKREGWKAVGALRAQGQFPGDFRSVNEDFVIPIWYNYGQARSCYDTPAQFFVRESNGESFKQANYHPAAHITREGDTRLKVYAAGPAPDSMQIFAVENFEEAFDRQATPAHFARQNQPARRINTQFGPAITLVGVDLPITAVKPGDTLAVNLYWQALDAPGGNYRAFVHLTGGAALWGQQDDSPACRLPTNIWRPGQRAMGQFRLPIPPDIPPGRYPLIVGLYHADTLERLKITAGAGQVGDDFLWLGDVEVVNR
jgi:hypothetical protein